MKYVFVLLVAVAGLFCSVNAVMHETVKQYVRPRLIQCAKDLGVSQKDLNAVINNDLSNTSTPLQCLALCFYASVRIMDYNGNLNVEASRVLFMLGETPANVDRVIKACLNIKGYSPCNTAYLTNKCYVEQGLL